MGVFLLPTNEYDNLESETNGQYTIVSGQDILIFLSDINSASQQVAQMLQHAPYVYKHTPEILRQHILDGQSVVALASDDVVAHCKLELHPDVNENSLQVVELGSVVVDPVHIGKGLGKVVVQQGVALWQDLLPDSQLIAVVAKDNITSHKIFTALGGVPIQKPQNVQYKIPGEKIVYEIPPRLR